MTVAPELLGTSETTAPADLLRVLHMVEAAVASAPGDAGTDAATPRLVTVLLDGLCT